MSDIKVGDLVVCLWPKNPEFHQWAGTVRRVRERSSREGHWRLEPATICRNGREGAWKPEHLKRIPPLSELESEKKQEEIKA